MERRVDQTASPLQEFCGLWEQVEEETKLKKIKIRELNDKLTKCETQRTDKVSV